jgi:hypothetical protein
MTILSGSKSERSTGFAVGVAGGATIDRYRVALHAVTQLFLPSQQAIFFCSIVCFSGEKIVAVSHIKYDLLGFDVRDSGCVVASVFGELSPMLAGGQDSAHRRSLPRQDHGSRPR